LVYLFKQYSFTEQTSEVGMDRETWLYSLYSIQT
jgi:hypothetical protein